MIVKFNLKLNIILYFKKNIILLKKLKMIKFLILIYDNIIKK